MAALLSAYFSTRPSEGQSLCQSRQTTNTSAHDYKTLGLIAIRLKRAEALNTK